MKKLFFLCLATILLVGCEVERYETEPFNNIRYEVIIDSTTCVEYLSSTIKQKGGLSPRYNQDGTIRVNEECLKKTGVNKE